MDQPQKRSGILGYPYEPWSDSESESQEMEEYMYKLSSKKQVNTESTHQSADQVALVVESNDTPKPTSAQLANKLKQLLVRVQHETKKLSPKDVRPNLHRLLSSLDSARSLSKDLVHRNRPRTELAEVLKEDLQIMCVIAVKLHVPNGRREKAAYYGLSRVRRQLNTAASLATNLHMQMKDEVCKPTGSAVEEHTIITTTSSSTYWKPSLRTPFFLKPSTLVPKSLTEGQQQSLAEAQLNNNDIGEDNKTHTVNSSSNWKPSLNTSFFLKTSTLVPKPLTEGLKKSLAEALVTSKDDLPLTVEYSLHPGVQIEASHTCKTNHLSCARENHESSSTYWKPSLNTSFFLKPSTLDPKPLTERQKKSLAEALAIGDDIKVDQHPHYDKVLSDALPTAVDKGNKPEKPTEKPNSGHWKPSLNTQFFLKKPTLIHTSPTAEHIQNLVQMLTSAPRSMAKTQNKENHEKEEKHVFIRASVDLQNVLSHSFKKSEPAKRTMTPLLIKVNKSAAPAFTREAVLDDVVDVGLVKKSHHPTKERKTTRVFQSLQSTKRSSTFKPGLLKGCYRNAFNCWKTKTSKEVAKFVNILQSN